MSDPDPATVWIVDDALTNRTLFASIVETLGYEATTFDGGEEAVAEAARVTPDLVLLDVMMPGLGGFESCRELRRRFGDEMVPIVMITANPDRAMYAKGLEAGADDYLFQPIDIDAMRSRINAMLRLRNAYQEVAETKRKLAQRVEVLRREVAETERVIYLNERLQSVGLLVAGIAHELKNPLGAVRFNLDWAHERLGQPLEPDTERVRRDLRDAVANALEATTNLEQLVDELSTFTRPDRADGDDRSSLIQVVDSALRVTRHSVVSHARIDKQIPADLEARIPPPRLVQVVVNLLVNAARAVAQTGERGLIRIAARRQGDAVELAVEDSGVGLPEGEIFEPFYTTDEESTGLGLSICAQIVSRAGGEIGAAASELGGAKIWLRLPAAEE